MDFLFGSDMPLAVRFFFAFIIVLALIGGTAFLVRRFGGDRLGASSSRGRQPRLAVIDAAAVDGRRRLILIRRDNVEHLLMIGGPSDVVVEANIVRAAQGARDAPGQRPQAAPIDSLPRPSPAPLNDTNMWPLQPEPAPASVIRPPRQQVEESMQWNEPEPPALPLPPRRPEPRMEIRPEPRAEMRPEPRSSELRAEPRADMRAEPRTADPLAGLAAELSRVQPEPAPIQKFRAPPRDRDIPRARTPQPDRSRSTMTPPATDETDEQNADQNLAEMAQRLEAALRRPRAPEPRIADPAPREREIPSRPSAKAAPAAPGPISDAMKISPVADAIPQADNGATSQAPARGAPAKPQKSAYDSLEQEMASLLGRPNGKT